MAYVISSGITSDGVIVENNSMTVLDGGIANNTTVCGTLKNAAITYGYLHISSGGQANNTTVKSRGAIYVSSGGVANSTTVYSGGSGTVDSRGIANSVTVNEGGFLTILSRGTATEIIENGGHVEVLYEAKAKFANNVFSGVISNAATVHSGTTANSATILYYLRVYSGGIANDTVIDGSGTMVIYSGGLADRTSVTGIAGVAGKLYVSNGGVVSNTKVNGILNIYSGGTANATTINTVSGCVTVSSGGIANETTLMSGSFVISAGGTANNTTLSGGDMYISAAGTANDTTINIGTVNVRSGGTANNTTINEAGIFYVSSSCTAIDTTINGGIMHLSVASANNITVNKNGYFFAGSSWITNIIENGGYVDVNNCFSASFSQNTFSGLTLSQGATIHSGTTAKDVIIDSGGSLYVYSGGVASNTKVGKKGELNVYSGACVSDTIIDENGILTIMSGGIVNNTVINYEGIFGVTSNTTANGAIVNPEGSMLIYAEGVANNIIENGGYVYIEDGANASFASNTFSNLVLSDYVRATVHSGTTANNVLIEEDGRLYIYSGGKITGQMIFEDGAIVSAYTGAILDFDISNMNPNDTTRISNLSIVQGAPLYTLTVSETQKSGTYLLATSATSFSPSAVALQYSSGKSIGNLILGESFELGETSYTLNLNNSTLSLVVTSPDENPPTVSNMKASTTSPTNQDVIITAVFDDDSGVVSPFYKIDDGKWMDYKDGGVTVEKNSTVFFKAIDAAGNESEVKSITVKNIDKIKPTISGITQNSSALVQSVTVTADFADDVELAQSLYKLGDNGEWTAYDNGVTVTANSTVYFKAVDAAGNESEVVSYTVSNIDNVAPSAPTGLMSFVVDRNVALVWDVSTDDSGVKEYVVTYSLDGQEFTVRTSGTSYVLKDADFGAWSWSVQAVDAAGNESEISVGEAFTVSGFQPYIVEYSTDSFEHVLRLTVSTDALDSFRLPTGTYEWRMRSESVSDWQTGDPIVSIADNVPTFVKSDADGNDDLFFANACGVWEVGYVAQHVGSIEDLNWGGTKEYAAVSGKNKLADIFEGSDDANILLLTDDANGDALFVDDIYTELPGTLEEQQARIARIDEIRAGAGDDIVDMTSQRFEYIGGGMIVYGGDGNDTIWANKGANTLLGDAGNDRIVGASGDDVIAGGIGDDKMHGGGGDDVFAFCGNWGKDTVQQLETGKVTLWFASGELTNWDESELTYSDGENSVTVKGVTAEQITLKFGDDGSAQFASLSDLGAFDAFTSRNIFEEATLA